MFFSVENEKSKTFAHIHPEQYSQNEEKKTYSNVIQRLKRFSDSVKIEKIK